MSTNSSNIIHKKGRMNATKHHLEKTQALTNNILLQKISENFKEISDCNGFYQDFLELNIFNVEGINYDKLVELN